MIVAARSGNLDVPHREPGFRVNWKGVEQMGRNGHSRLKQNHACGQAIAAIIAVLILLISVSAQNLPESPKPQNNAPVVPDSTSKPAPQQPIPPPNAPPPGSATQPAPPVAQPEQDPGDAAGAATTSGTEPLPPAPTIKTVPPGTTTPDNRTSGSRDEIFTLRKNVNFVLVPVTVKGPEGHLVEGLLRKDFAVYEDGVKQNITFFTSDPFPLSAAVVIDLGMSDTEVAKVRETLPALIGAFGQFDEVSIYSYGNTVKKWQDFMPATSVTPTVLSKLKAQKGRSSGAPVVGGPLGQSGPVINGRNMDNTPNMPSTPNTSAIRESRVLNDAMLAAASDLGKRDRARRKIIFVISDGRELGSSASYADVMKVLLSNEISVYAVGVGGAAIPGYRTLQKFRIPGMGYGDILPKYASATGGQVFPEFSTKAIETAYTRVTEEARNQYTLGYTTRATPSSAYRSVEVRVVGHGSDLRVFAKDGYYPLPVAR